MIIREVSSSILIFSIPAPCLDRWRRAQWGEGEKRKKNRPESPVTLMIERGAVAQQKAAMQVGLPVEGG
jgi:hypothetical protein